MNTEGQCRNQCGNATLLINDFRTSTLDLLGLGLELELDLHYTCTRTWERERESLRSDEARRPSIGPDLLGVVWARNGWGWEWLRSMQVVTLDL